MIEAVNVAVLWLLHDSNFEPLKRPGLGSDQQIPPYLSKVFCVSGNGVGSLKKLGHARTRGGKI